MRPGWAKIDRSEYRHTDGHRAIKYRMASVYYWLLYPAGQPLEGGDYKTFNSLFELKSKYKEFL